MRNKELGNCKMNFKWDWIGPREMGGGIKTRILATEVWPSALALCQLIMTSHFSIRTIDCKNDTKRQNMDGDIAPLQVEKIKRSIDSTPLRLVNWVRSLGAVINGAVLGCTSKKLLTCTRLTYVFISQLVFNFVGGFLTWHSTVFRNGCGMHARCCTMYHTSSLPLGD